LRLIDVAAVAIGFIVLLGLGLAARLRAGNFRRAIHAGFSYGSGRSAERFLFF